MAVFTADLSEVSSATRSDRLALQQTFETLSEESCPTSYNFHLHTCCSDGQLEPSALIGQVLDIGLKGLAITDHHSLDGYWEACYWLASRTGNDLRDPLPALWTGIEINAGLLDTEVHILGYAFDPNHEALAPYVQGQPATGDRYPARRVIAALHEAGGLAVLAHPARYRQPARELIPAAAALGIDGAEVYYAYGNPKPWCPSDRETREVRSLAKRYGLLGTCGTDTHGTSILYRV